MEKDYNKLYLLRRRKTLKIKGVCPNCGVRKAESGRTCCMPCLIKKRMDSSGLRGTNYEILAINQKGFCACCMERVGQLAAFNFNGTIRGLMCRGCMKYVTAILHNDARLVSSQRYVKTLLKSEKVK